MPSFGLLWKPIVVAVIGVGGLHAIVRKNQPKIDRFVMGIVRDVGRYKAKKRRHQTTKGLMVFLKDNDPLEDLIEQSEQEKSLDDLPTYTADELYEFGNGLDEKPILIGMLGRVYDVSSGSKFYGPGAPYGHFAGFDVTYSLCTGCKSVECVQEPPPDAVENLTAEQMKEGQKWLSFFHLHDKYPLVGKLEDDPLEEILNSIGVMGENDSGEAVTGEDGELKPPILQ